MEQINEILTLIMNIATGIIILIGLIILVKEGKKILNEEGELKKAIKEKYKAQTMQMIQGPIISEPRKITKKEWEKITGKKFL